MNVEAARSWYPASDPVHGFEHIERVARLAERLAIAEGADLEIVRAAALLHDARPPQADDGDLTPTTPPSERESHHHTSAEFAARILRKRGWSEERIAAVQHCILAHRFRHPSETPHSLEAQVLFDADKLDAIGAIGVARAIAYAIQHNQPFFAVPSPGFIQSGVLESGESHSAYHEYCFKLRHLKEYLYTAAGRAMAEERHQRMAQFFQDLAAEIQGES